VRNFVVKYINDTRLPIILIWVAFLLALASNYRFENGDTMVVAYIGKGRVPYFFNDYYYFVTTSLMLACVSAVPICFDPKRLIFGVFFSLCVGKVGDEISHITFLGAQEFLFDIFIFTLAMILWSSKKFKAYLARRTKKIRE